MEPQWASQVCGILTVVIVSLCEMPCYFGPFNTEIVLYFVKTKKNDTPHPSATGNSHIRLKYKHNLIFKSSVYILPLYTNSFIIHGVPGDVDKGLRQDAHNY